jgi:ParB/RepB/Spo0J family partition protein
MQTPNKPTLVPLGLIVPDPGNPRPQPSAPELEDLVRLIRTEGLLQPITVTLHPDPAAARDTPYMILHGARRFAAVSSLGQPEIAAFLDDRPLQPFERILAQLAENDGEGRAEIALFHRALAIAEAYRLSGALDQKTFARRTGHTASWLASHLQLARADGLLREALAEGHLRRATAAQVFRRLHASTQLRLLQRARRSAVLPGGPQPISERACIEAEKLQVAPPEPPDEAHGGEDRDPSDHPSAALSAARPVPPSTAPRPGDSAVPITFTAEQLRTLIVLLGGSPAGGLQELASQFLALVEGLSTNPLAGDLS